MPPGQPLSLAHPPDRHSDYCYFALKTGRLAVDRKFEFHAQPIAALDQAAREGRFDITTISAAAYFDVAEEYRILSVGASVGRGFGPLLVSRHYFHVDQLQFRRVGVAGASTTSGCLLKWACPDALACDLPPDEVAAAVASGQLDAGVLRPDEFAFDAQFDLHLVVDLGRLWTERTGLPLPIQLNVIRRSLGEAPATELCDVLRESLLYGKTHRAEAIDWASRLGSSARVECKPIEGGRQFANADSLYLAEDVRISLGLLLPVVKKQAKSDRKLPQLDILDGSNATAAGLLAALAA